MVGSAAQAQTVAPMTAAVGAYGEQFLVRLNVRNPYPDTRDFTLAAFDEAGGPISVWSSAPAFRLAAGKGRMLAVSAPFEGRPNRRIVLCVETVAGETETGRLLTQVCSTVQAERLG